jgi:hypothetical protein
MTLLAAQDNAEVDGFTVSDDGRRAVIAWNLSGSAISS